MDYAIRTPAQLGQVLKGLRRDRRLTQAAVAARMGLVQSKVSTLEADPGKTSVDRFFRLLSALGMELVLREKGGTTNARGRKKPLW